MTFTSFPWVEILYKLLYFVYSTLQLDTVIHSRVFYPRYCVRLSCNSTMWFDYQIGWFRSGHRGGVMTELSFKVNSRGQHPGSEARSHKGPVSVRVPAENLSVGGIVLTSKSRERNYWLTAMWQWYFLFPEALLTSEGRARQSEKQQSD